MTDSQILALIPARSGSRSIIHKNILEFCGKPLMAHSIEQARETKQINRVIVSTDSEDYARIAREYGAEAPFIRPAEFSEDLSTDFEVFDHCLRYLAETESYVPDICVHLRPTYPLRKVADIEAMIEMLLGRPDLDSVRSVTPSPLHPLKMWSLDENGILNTVMDSDLREPYNRPRQSLPDVYMQNASIDVVRSSVILEKKSMTGDRIGAFVMNHFHDIDFEEDFRAAELFFERHTEKQNKKRFVFDIDGVIASLAVNGEYNLARPLELNIRLVNQLYYLGHEIVLFTARGSKTGIDWKGTTERQMKEWGVKYHALEFGKPHADFYIDDRFVSLAVLRDMLSDSAVQVNGHG